jgi:hypothetical protein
MAASAAYLAIKGTSKQQTSSQTPQTVSQQNPDQGGDGNILDKVKRHLYVPDGDQPRYTGTISDISLLRSKNPDFYANAEEGDKVLIWNDRAVIYSAKKDLIIAVATAKPLLADDRQPQAGSSSTASASSTTAPAALQPTDLATQLASTTVEIRNGSRVNGAAEQLRIQLSQQAVNVIRIGNALPRQGTLVIDQTSGTAPGVVNLLLQATNGTVSDALPPDELPTTAGILVIIGK